MLRFFHLATKVNPLSSASPNQEAAEKPRSQTYSNLSFAQAAVTLSRMLLGASIPFCLTASGLSPSAYSFGLAYQCHAPNATGRLSSLLAQPATMMLSHSEPGTTTGPPGLPQ